MIGLSALRAVYKRRIRNFRWKDLLSALRAVYKDYDQGWSKIEKLSALRAVYKVYDEVDLKDEGIICSTSSL